MPVAAQELARHGFLRTFAFRPVIGLTQPSRGLPMPRFPSTMSELVSQVRAFPRRVAEFIHFRSCSCMYSCEKDFLLTLFIRLTSPKDTSSKSLVVSYAPRGAFSATAHVRSCSGTCARHFPVIFQIPFRDSIFTDHL